MLLVSPFYRWRYEVQKGGQVVCPNLHNMVVADSTTGPSSDSQPCAQVQNANLFSSGQILCPYCL